MNILSKKNDKETLDTERSLIKKDGTNHNDDDKSKQLKVKLQIDTSPNKDNNSSDDITNSDDEEGDINVVLQPDTPSPLLNVDDNYYKFQS